MSGCLLADAQVRCVGRSMTNPRCIRGSMVVLAMRSRLNLSASPFLDYLSPFPRRRFLSHASVVTHWRGRCAVLSSVFVVVSLAVLSAFSLRCRRCLCRLRGGPRRPLVLVEPLSFHVLCSPCSRDVHSCVSAGSTMPVMERAVRGQRGARRCLACAAVALRCVRTVLLATRGGRKRVQRRRQAQHLHVGPILLPSRVQPVWEMRPSY